MVWYLEDFVDIDLSSKSSLLARKQRKPHKTKAIELPQEGICCPLKSEYDYANSTLEGLRQTSPPSLLELPKVEEATVRDVPHGDRWIQMGMHWMRIHVTPRDSLYTPLVGEEGPDLSTLSDTRITFKSFLHGRTQTISDDWRDATSEVDDSSWMGTTTFLARTSSGSIIPSYMPVHIVEQGPR